MLKLLALSALGTGLLIADRRGGLAPVAEREHSRFQALCHFDSSDGLTGPTIVSDRPNGVSSDGRGPYGLKGDGAVVEVRRAVGMSIWGPPRQLIVNLNRPVPGGGARRLGIITDRNVSGAHGELGVHAQWKTLRDTSRTPLAIPVGATVAAAQMNVFFHINDRFHVLQMGPQPYGHCYGLTRVQGTGTSQGTISRPAPTKWVMDLPPGSVGRLFDVSKGRNAAVDLGTYYVEMHYEIVDAVPPVASVLQRMAVRDSGPTLVARYLTLKRDSAKAYQFDESELNGVGFWLVGKRRYREALMLFQLNIEEYPASSNAYGGLGVSYLGMGDTAKAVANIRRAVELDPKNQDALDDLQRLGIKPSIRGGRPPK